MTLGGARPTTGLLRVTWRRPGKLPPWASARFYPGAVLVPPGGSDAGSLPAGRGRPRRRRHVVHFRHLWHGRWHAPARAAVAVHGCGPGDGAIWHHSAGGQRRAGDALVAPRRLEHRVAFSGGI